MKWDSGQLLNLLNWFVYLDLGQAAMTSAKLYYKHCGCETRVSGSHSNVTALDVRLSGVNGWGGGSVDRPSFQRPEVQTLSGAQEKFVKFFEIFLSQNVVLSRCWYAQPPCILCMHKNDQVRTLT